MFKRIKQYFTQPAKAKTEDVFEHAQIDITFNLTLSFAVLYAFMLVAFTQLDTSFAFSLVNYASSVGIILSIIVLRVKASYQWAGFVFWLMGFFTSNAMVFLSKGQADLQFGVWHSFSIVIAFSLLGRKWGLLNAIYMIALTVLVVLNHMNGWNLFDIGLDRGPDIDRDPVPVAIPMVATTYIMYQTLRTRRQAQDIISAQKQKETDQRKELERKNIEILDSIQYAKRIQRAILPPDKLVRSYLSNSFILYKPKDIVAGDFYWMEPFDNGVLFAAADCTGHGVPGAMVSVVCNNGLNRSRREHNLLLPGEILDKTRELVVQEFEKSEEEVKDGMDIALCSLEGMTLKYAGANNPLWIIRNGELLETKADKQPIGQFDHPKPYTTHTFELQKGDAFYIFSDGYADQFGGEKGKKFKAANMKKLLLSVQDKTIEQQRQIIDDTFEAWKGDLEQLDDVCVIGVKVE